MSNHWCYTPIPFDQQFVQARRVFKPRVFSRGSTAYLGFEDSTSKIIRALQFMPISALCKTPLEGTNSDFMFCLYQILQHLTLTECEPNHPKAVFALHRKYSIPCTTTCTSFIAKTGYEFKQSLEAVQTQETVCQQWFPEADSTRASLLH